MNASRTTRSLALVLAVALPALWAPIHAAPVNASLSGVVLSAFDAQPLSGATVWAADRETGRVFPSDPDGANGGYKLSDLPPSTYDLAVESDGGLYVVGQVVQLAPGQAREVDLAVRQNAPNAKPTSGSGGAGGAAAGGSIWSNPFTAALLVLGSAIVVGAVVEAATDDEDDASPF